MRVLMMAALAAATLGAGAARAALVTDVDNLVAFGPIAGASTVGLPGGAQHLAGTTAFSDAYQTWTVGVSGTLDAVDVVGYVSHSPRSSVSITAGIYGGGAVDAIGTQLLGQIDLSFPDGSDVGTQIFDFSGLAIHALAGEVLTLKISGDCAPVSGCIGDFDAINRQKSGTNPEVYTPVYAGGTAFFGDVGGPLQASQYDLSFRTVMDADPVRAGVPEPASWALMLLGFGGLGAVLRRRRSILA